MPDARQPVLVYDRIDANTRNTRLLLVGFCLLMLPVVLAAAMSLLPLVLFSLVFFVAALVSDVGDPFTGGPLLAGFYLVLPVMFVLGVRSVVRSLMLRFGSRMILRLARATPVGPDEEPALVRTVEHLCIGAGLPVPNIHLIESLAPNAFATGPDPEHASLVVTRGLLELLDHRELEAVIAHELSHIGNHDIQLTTALAALVTVAISPFSLCAALAAAMVEGETSFSSESVIFPLAMLAGTGFFILFGLQVDGGWWWGPAALFYLLLVSPVAALLIRTGVSRQREFLADADAVELTRDPESLALALVKIGSARGERLRVSEGVVHLYVVDPVSAGTRIETWWQELDASLHRFFPSHPPLDERIELLARMGSGIGREALEAALQAGADAREAALELEPDDSPADQPDAPVEAVGSDPSPGQILIPVYEKPDGWSRVLAQLPHHAQVTIVGTDGNFIRVRTGDNVLGYVARSAPIAALRAANVASRRS